MTELHQVNDLRCCLREPREDEIPQLRSLWKAAFGDTDAYLDSFFRTAFSPRRCRAMFRERQLLGAAYWLDCRLEDRTIAYVYAVAITPGCQGQGLGTVLMDSIHRELSRQGYDAVLLVPGDEGLRQFYGRFGYRTVSSHRAFTACAGTPVPLVKIGAEQYAALRKKLLPPQGVVQEGENLALLAELAEFYEGDGFIAAVSRQEQSCPELLGPAQAAGGIAAFLGMAECRFRTPGADTPYAMGKSLNGAILPENLYFGLGFD